VLTVTALAKINLTLEVLGKRPDGYHSIRSVIQTVNLCDRLHFKLSRQTEFKCPSAEGPEWAAEKSLVSHTVDLVRKITGYSEGVTIEVEKRIPLVSGLGGDSSDAVATLKGLNKLWQLGLPAEKLHELATQLGSDVPFFLNGGTALMEGRGETITPLPPLAETWLILMIPAIPRPPRKTEQLYAALKTNHYTDGQITERLTKEIRNGKKLNPALLFNTFENVAFERYAELAVYRDHILKIGATNVHLAGSGPALFTVVNNKAEGEDIVKRLKSQHLDLHLVQTMVNMGNRE
jgi:4-diphosphocytidyl-2-C-methyl-D-erythritol kinase